MDEAIGEDVIDGDGGAASCAATDAAEESAGVDKAGCEFDVVCGACAWVLDPFVPFVDAELRDWPLLEELATAAAYRIGGKAGLEPAVPGAPDGGNPALSACDIG